MAWTKLDNDRKSSRTVSMEYDKVRQELLPEIQKEADAGVKLFEPVQFQPIQSPGYYEAEFGLKHKDVIFHFWPWKYREMERSGKRLPTFPSNFGSLLSQAISQEFGNFMEASFDPDMGSWFVRCQDAGLKTFWRELAIRACEGLYRLLDKS